VVRDTERNLEMIDFISEHCSDEESKWGVEQYRPYIIMMNTRAKASQELQEAKIGEAVRLIELGQERIERFYRSVNQPDWIETSDELAFLKEWMREIRETIPLSPLESMERDLKRAIADEAYERAAELRDAIHSLRREEKLPD
jgi:hypothetical protein